MKHIVITAVIIFGFFANANLWAEDITAPINTNAELVVNAAQLPTQQKVIKAPKLSRSDDAALHLGIIYDEIDKLKEQNFFNSFFSSTSDFHTALSQDIDLFLNLYSDLPIAADALMAKGKLQQKEGAKEKSTITWLQVLYEYPDSDAAMHSRKLLNEFVSKNKVKYAEDIKSMVSNVSKSETSIRLSQLIVQLYRIDDKKITQALLSLQYDILARFPQSSHADEVQVLLSHNLGSQSAESGVFNFKKLLALYPNSNYRAEAMLAIADLQRLRLKEYNSAVTNYNSLITAHPDHALTKYAYKNLAITYEKHLKNYPEAIASYHTIIERYTDDKVALYALQHTAKIQEKKTKELEASVATLRKLATLFHGYEAVDALEAAIKIASRKLKDPELTIAAQQQLIDDYPNSDAAPETLFDMAKAAEKQSKSTALYQTFIEKYPSHRLARKAQKKLMPK